MRNPSAQCLIAALLSLPAWGAAADPDLDPLAAPARTLRETLAGYGLDLHLDTAFSYQRASETQVGERDLGVFAYDVFADWRAFDHPVWGRGRVRSEWVGSVGLDHGFETLEGNLGSVSTQNALVELHGGALTELSWEQGSPDGRFAARLGRIDMKSAFDSNRVANDPYGHFLAGELENNASIPFPAYGGLGAVLRAAPAEGWGLRAGAGQSNVSEPFAFWRSLDEDSWWVLVEVERSGRLAPLGRGALRLTPWHQRLRGRSGFGAGLGAEQELGHERLVAFLRLGIGDGDVTPAEHFASGGLAFQAPFGREGDRVALGVAWSDPGFPARDQTLLELAYRVALTPSLGLTPDLQMLCPVGLAPGRSCEWVGGLRLALRF